MNRMKVDYLTERTYYMGKECKEIATGPNNAIVYGEIVKGGRNIGRTSAVGFQGKRGKPDWHFIFPTIERRDQKIKEYFEGIEAREKMMSEIKASRTAPAEEQRLVPGTILYSSWDTTRRT